MPKRPQDQPDQSIKDGRRKFLKKAGTIVVAVPVMESLSREGLIVRSAHAQTIGFGGLGGPMAGPIVEPG